MTKEMKSALAEGAAIHDKKVAEFIEAQAVRAKDKTQRSKVKALNRP